MFKLGSFEARHPKIVLIGVLLFTLISIPGVINLRVETAYEKMLPASMDVIQTLHLVQDEYGGSDVIQILVDAEDVRDPKTLLAINALENRIKKEKWVSEVIGLSSVVEEDYGCLPSSKETITEIVERNPAIKELVSDNYRFALINVMVNIPYDPAAEGEITKHILKDIEYAGVSGRISGWIPLDYESYLLLIDDMAVIGILGVVLVLSAVILYFRSVVKGILSLSPVVLGILWTGGWMGYLGVPFTFTTVGLVAILFGLGVDYGIHIIHRYEEGRRKGKDIAKAIMESVVNIGMGLTTVTATTMAGFLGLLVADLAMVKQLGEVLALGMLFCFAAALFTVPSILVLKEGKTKNKRGEESEI